MLHFSVDIATSRENVDSVNGIVTSILKGSNLSIVSMV